MKVRTLAVFLLVLFLAMQSPCTFAKHSNHKKPTAGAATGGEPSAQYDSAADSGASAEKTDSSDNTGAEDISGVNTAGTVRVNNLANLEALLNIIANGTEILGISYGVNLFLAGIIVAIVRRTKRWIGAILFFCGCFSITAGLATPGIINWLVASARDANLFSCIWF